MVKASQLYSGNYLTATELPPGRHSAVIFSVETEMVGQGTDQSEKLVLALTSRGGRAWPKTLVLNKGNALVLSAAYGDETDEWPGKPIVVWSDPSVMYAGKRVGGIRLDVPSPQAGNGSAGAPASPRPSPPGAAAPPAAGPVWPGTDDLDDGIPF